MACHSHLPPNHLRTRAEKIKCALKNTGLTLSRLSVLTSNHYGRASPYFIPPTFLYKLATGVTPHVCQIAALSVVTSYRFTDWMTAFGFDLDQIPRLQVKLHREHTVLVTPIERDKYGRLSPPGATSTVAKTRTLPHWASKLIHESAGPYLYAKIGDADTSAFPELLPGSIVRVDTRRVDVMPFGDDANRGPICLVEYLGGLTCCRVKRLDDRHVLLLSNQSVRSSFPLRLDQEARILGRVDGELRPRQATPAFKPVAESGIERSLLHPNPESGSNLSDLVRTSRQRSSLTFRSAHEMSLKIARAMNDKHYAISIGLLSDYEAIETPPRHAAKIMTFCILYGIEFFQYLRCANIRCDDSSKSPPMQPMWGRQQEKLPVPWAAGRTTRTDFPRSLIVAQNEASRSLGRIAM
jgi:hypothetical protein